MVMRWPSRESASAAARPAGPAPAIAISSGFSSEVPAGYAEEPHRFSHAVNERVRRHGWAHNRAEETAGASAVAAPVRDGEGNVAAAISLDLLDRFSSANVDLHARACVAAASRITAAIRRHALAA